MRYLGILFSMAILAVLITLTYRYYLSAKPSPAVPIDTSLPAVQHQVDDMQDKVGEYQQKLDQQLNTLNP